jgi:tyrosyl-tRNA synthetase
LPLDEITELEKLKGSDINNAKIVLADEATSLLHGKECLKVIHDTIKTMFSGSGASTESLPRVYVKKEDVAEGVRVLDLIVELGLASSKQEARRLIKGGGARKGDTEKITDENASLTEADFGDSKELTLRAGKKRAGVVELQE